MSLEGGHLPQKNRLPLDVRDSELLAKSGESDVWRADVKDSHSQEQKVVLKENRQLDFASDEEMQRSKEYYEYLKNFPGFGKFIPDTLYFKARIADGEPARSYSTQHLLAGKTINRFTDPDLYQDPEIVKELREFVDGAISILQATRAEKKVKPDFGKSPDDDEYGTKMANQMLNPRYSNNIFITDAPDENGRRVFFVDTGEGVRERTQKLWNLYQRQVLGRIQEARLESWKKELEAHTKNTA